MSPLQTVLDRVAAHRVRPSGPGRWRCAGFCHGGANRSAVSIGEGEDGAVLLRCWAGCSVETMVSALGLEVADLFPPRPSPGGGASKLARRRLLSASQALELLADEAMLLIICAADMAQGLSLDQAAHERLRRAAARINMLRAEVAA